MTLVQSLGICVAKYIKRAAESSSAPVNALNFWGRRMPLMSYVVEGLTDANEAVANPGKFFPEYGADVTGRPESPLTDATNWNRQTFFGNDVTNPVGATLLAQLNAAGSPLRSSVSSLQGLGELPIWGAQNELRSRGIGKQVAALRQREAQRSPRTGKELALMAKSLPGSMYFDEQEGKWAPTWDYYRTLSRGDQQRMTGAFSMRWKPQGWQPPQAPYQPPPAIPGQQSYSLQTKAYQPPPAARGYRPYSPQAQSAALRPSEQSRSTITGALGRALPLSVGRGLIQGGTHALSRSLLPGIGMMEPRLLSGIGMMEPQGLVLPRTPK